MHYNICIILYPPPRKATKYKISIIIFVSCNKENSIYILQIMIWYSHSLSNGAYGIISPWVFPDEAGECLDSLHLYHNQKSYRKQHGIERSPYKMRHTMISLSQADVPEHLLKRMVGHSKAMDTFKVYGHEVDGEMPRAAGILDRAFNRILEQCVLSCVPRDKTKPANAVFAGFVFASYVKSGYHIIFR